MSGIKKQTVNQFVVRPIEDETKIPEFLPNNPKGDLSSIEDIEKELKENT